jgi:hypothetical protein
MQHAQKSIYGSYKVSGGPDQHRMRAKAAFMMFHALRMLEDEAAGASNSGARTGAPERMSTPDGCQALVDSDEARTHAEKMVSGLEAAAKERGWAIRVLNPRIIDDLHRMGNLSIPSGCTVLGLENADGKISPIAFDARTVIYQIKGGAYALGYSGVVDLKGTTDTLGRLGFAETFV